RERYCTRSHGNEAGDRPDNRDLSEIQHRMHRNARAWSPPQEVFVVGNFATSCFARFTLSRERFVMCNTMRLRPFGRPAEPRVCARSYFVERNRNARPYTSKRLRE